MSSKKYIEKEAFIKWVEETYCKPCEAEGRDYNHCRCGSCQYDDMMRDAESFDAADVAPVRHGRWIKPTRVPDSMLDECSLCGFDCGAYTFNYCPNCGALMNMEDTYGKTTD